MTWSRRTRKRLLLVDSATSGCAGAYIDGLYRNLDDREAVDVAVSHYFPYAYGKKLFYKYSELAAQSRYRLGRARLYVRFLELVAAFARLFAAIVRERYDVVCYALSSNLFLEYAFLWAVKHVARTRVFIICHDVIPFTLPHEDLEAKVRRRARFYRLADRLVVHNENSEDDLHRVFQVPSDKVGRFPFPIYELDRMQLQPRPVLPPQSARRFLFIGHLRPEKGVDILIDAWKRLDDSRPAELVIAGNIPAGCHYDFESIADRGLIVMPRYLTDEEYVSLIAQAHCVVLPYTRGTNSAVVSTVSSSRRNLIVSDIEMFRNNPLIPRESFFRSGDAASLAQRLAHFRDLSADHQLLLQADVERRFDDYERDFRERLNAVLGEARRSSAPS